MSERALIAECLLSKVAERLAVLGQVVRLRLVEQLASGSATPQELADALGLTQQNVSKPEGANVIYSLKDESTVRCSRTWSRASRSTFANSRRSPPGCRKIGPRRSPMSVRGSALTVVRKPV